MDRWGRGLASLTAPLVVGLAVAVASGCTTSGGTSTPSGSTATVTASVTNGSSDPSPSTSPVATPSGSATVAPLPSSVPAAARTRDGAGAEAFVRHFYDQVNVAWTLPKAGLLPPLCLATSKSCASFEAEAAGLVSKHHRYSGAPVTLSSVVDLGETDGLRVVDYRAVQERRDVLDSSGHPVLTDARKELHGEAALTWVGDGWRIATLKKVV